MVLVFFACFAAVHRLTGKPNSLYDAADGEEDSKYMLFASNIYN